MPKKEKKGLMEVDISFGGVSLDQKALFAKNLSLMLKSGLNITEALETLENEATGKFKKIISKILYSVEAGSSLSQALTNYPSVFSQFFINTTLAGETSGNLENSLENIADQLKKDKELISKIKSAMLYPLIVLIGASVLGLCIAFFVLPKITPLFEGLKVDLPWSTKALISFSKFIQKSGIPLIVGTFGSISLLLWAARQKFSRPFTNFLIIHIPLIKGISINSNLANFSRTLGTLLKSGLNIDEALGIVKDTVSNYYFHLALEKASLKVSQGSSLSDSLQGYDNLFPRLIINMIKVGEKSGNLEAIFFHMADYYETEVDNATKSLSTSIEPILLIFIGIFVGGLAISIITPIYKITGSVNK